MKQWRAADKLYLAQLKVINLTFLAAVATAKMDLSTSLASATDATERISARATYRYAITEATIARSNALTILGKRRSSRQEARDHHDQALEPLAQRSGCFVISTASS